MQLSLKTTKYQQLVSSYYMSDSTTNYQKKYEILQPSEERKKFKELRKISLMCVYVVLISAIMSRVL